MNIMKEIEKAVNNEERDAANIVANLKKLGIYMFATNSISKDMVVSFCSGLIKVYNELESKKES